MNEERFPRDAAWLASLSWAELLDTSRRLDVARLLVEAHLGPWQETPVGGMRTWSRWSVSAPPYLTPHLRGPWGHFRATLEERSLGVWVATAGGSSQTLRSSDAAGAFHESDNWLVSLGLSLHA